MSVESLKSMVHSKETTLEAKPPVKNETEKVNNKEKSLENANDTRAMQKETVAQILTIKQPETQINNTAQEQIAKGYLDVKV